ncbi:acid protease [Trametes versicolor FP-101664 SS1]|uniref:acid protease n=1 Tax=Trametes versicolor (strain FP-101664) TaxID=717944 RepID=UPI0004623A9B|nr:acid protease [Trametes versicolor FP-101664 SS1]EIW64104.1 acid protease [Trametes versicolor FP-101664 SS1]
MSPAGGSQSQGVFPGQTLTTQCSSDTWIDVSVGPAITPPDMFYSGFNTSTAYADGTEAPGMVMLANVTLGPYTVNNQAIRVVQNVAPSPDMISGLIGLSMIKSSTIFTALYNSSYAANSLPLLVNVFAQTQEEHNYFTFLMDRDELGVTNGGTFTVSELITEYASITSAPHMIPVIDQGWETHMDGMTINGQFMDGHSGLISYATQFRGGLPPGKTIAVVDSGSSFMLIMATFTTVMGPPAYVDAAYKNIPGAILTNDTAGAGPAYIIPCDTKLNLTLHFGGQPFPIHPLDAVIVNQTANGLMVCLSALSMNLDPVDLASDWLIGDTFMRNVYSLYDYGNMSNPNAGFPYMQLLSITDADAAWAETDALMLKRLVAYESYFTSTYGVTPTTTQRAYAGPTSAPALTSADDKQTFSPRPSASAAAVASSYTFVSESVSPNTLSGAVAENAVVGDSGSGHVDLSGLTRNTYIIIGLLAAALLLLVAVVALAVRASRANKGYRALGATGGPPKSFMSTYSE